MSKTYIATLKHGNTYTQIVAGPNGQATAHAFKKNEPKSVSATLKKLLEEKAVQEVRFRVGSELQVEQKQKFVFEEEASDADAKSAPRQRVASATTAPAS